MPVPVESMPSSRSSKREEPLSIDRVVGRLGEHGHLSHLCTLALSEAISSTHHGAKAIILRTSNPAQGLHTLRSGMAYRYTQPRDGKRQITGFIVPGDWFDVRDWRLGQIDGVVRTVGSAEACFISRQSLLECEQRFPDLHEALWFAILAEATRSQRWLSIVRLSAIERVAHLLCELYTRMGLVGLVSQRRCRMPVAQYDIADAIALTPIHVNRTLRVLRERDLATLRRGELIVPDFAALADLCGFEPAYLRPAAGTRHDMPVRPPAIRHSIGEAYEERR